MSIKRVKGNACGASLPGGLTGSAKATKDAESTHKENNKPAKRGEAGKAR